MGGEKGKVLGDVQARGGCGFVSAGGNNQYLYLQKRVLTMWQGSFLGPLKTKKAGGRGIDQAKVLRSLTYHLEGEGGWWR